MIELSLIVARFLQYSGAMVLCGSSLFFAYALPSGLTFASHHRLARRLLIGAALVSSVASLMAIALQASVFSGSFGEGFTRDAITSVVSFMGLGKAALVRAAAAGLAFVLLVAARPGRLTWIGAASLGGISTASLAWMGHGAATEGALGWAHLISDLIHALAAAVWLGALAGFVVLAWSRSTGVDQNLALHTALRHFSVIGSAAVAALVLTGLLNSWVLVGPRHVTSLLASPYGVLLALKLLAFAGMLGLAAANRFKLTPNLGSDITRANAPESSLQALRRSIALESTFGLTVLALVAWLGTLAPPNSV